MSALFCGLESLLCLACTRWAWRRCTHTGAHDSDSWPLSTPSTFAPLPRACRAVLAAYEADLARPQWAPSSGYDINLSFIARRATYNETLGRCPPYIIYSDPAAREVVLAICGLGLTHHSDYHLLLDNSHGGQEFDGGFVHRGLFRAASWLLEREGSMLIGLLLEQGPEGRLVLAGHSLGAGIAALLAVLIVNQVERSRVRCYAIAPPRSMSLDLAVNYADVIHSLVLQDDFLPRTPTPLEHMFGSMFCLPCLLFFVCMRDTFVPEDKMLKDPRRLYAPGRMYHIIERKSCRCGRFPPEVRTAVPVEGRFEHIVLSCNAIFDHSLVWIEREAEKALQRMNESYDVSTPPRQQTMERKHSLQKEYEDAMKRADTLSSLLVTGPAEASSGYEDSATCESQEELTSSSESQSSGRSNWDELVEKLLDREDLVDPFPVR